MLGESLLATPVFTLAGHDGHGRVSRGILVLPSLVQVTYQLHIGIYSSRLTVTNLVFSLPVPLDVFQDANSSLGHNKSSMARPKINKVQYFLVPRVTIDIYGTLHPNGAFTCVS